MATTYAIDMYGLFFKNNHPLNDLGFIRLNPTRVSTVVRKAQQVA